MVSLSKLDLAYRLDRWRKEEKLDLGQLQEAVWVLRKQEEFQRGIAHAERAQRLELVRQAARELNGGEDPEYHNCHFCGTYVYKGYEVDGSRHYLSDCRPDLVAHEPGETCTWWGVKILSATPGGQAACYAYQDRDTQEWGDEHKHFYDDGPM